METNKELKLEKLKSRQADNRKRSLIKGTIIIAFLTFSPYIFYAYKAFPSSTTWDTFLGTYTSNYWGDVQTFAWVLLGKILPLLLLAIWFFTCRHWWYHALLVPICMYAFQVIRITRDDSGVVDDFEIFILAPIIVIVAVFCYGIRTRIFDRIHGVDWTAFNRPSWKGELAPEQKKDNVIIENEFEEEEENDEEPLFMG